MSNASPETENGAPTGAAFEDHSHSNRTYKLEQVTENVKPELTPCG